MTDPEKPRKPSAKKQGELYDDATKVVDGVLRNSGRALDASTRLRYINGIMQSLATGTTTDEAQRELASAISGQTVDQQATSIFDTIRKENAPKQPTQRPGQANLEPVKVLQTAYRTLANSRPDPDDFPDEGSYDSEYSFWDEQMTSISGQLKAARELASGITRLEDNTIITKADYDALDDFAKAQVDRYIAKQNTDLENAYNATMNALDLSEFTTARAGVKDQNQKIIDDFANKTSAVTTSLSFDRESGDSAARKVSRMLNGQQESRQRADYVSSTDLAAAGKATGGKTSFSANDFGGILGDYASSVGLDPNAAAVRFPTTININPRGLLDEYDTRAGVGGALPIIPDLVTQAASLPQAPTLLDIPQGGPALRRPTMPPAYALPSDLRAGGGSLLE